MSERWLPITGFEGCYEVSDLGRIRSLPRKWCPAARILRPRYNTQGYVGVVLYDTDREPRNLLVHRLVCAAFNGSPPLDRRDVNHIDGVKANNAATNLEWTNDSLNVAHAFRVLGVKHAVTRPWLGKTGAQNPRSKAIVRIDANGMETRYDGISEAGRILGLSFRHISACCLGKRKRHGGFQWRFEEPKMTMYRQGDCGLIQINKIPSNAMLQKQQGNKLVLLHGESTGHSHAFHFQDTSHNVKLYVADGGARYLAVSAPAELLHEEHSTVHVPAGFYALPAQVEYTAAELRRVQD